MDGFASGRRTGWPSLATVPGIEVECLALSGLIWIRSGWRALGDPPADPREMFCQLCLPRCWPGLAWPGLVSPGLGWVGLESGWPDCHELRSVGRLVVWASGRLGVLGSGSGSGSGSIGPEMESALGRGGEGSGLSVVLALWHYSPLEGGRIDRLQSLDRGRRRPLVPHLLPPRSTTVLTCTGHCSPTGRTSGRSPHMHGYPALRERELLGIDRGSPEARPG
jgi:hypothetical protein